MGSNAPMDLEQLETAARTIMAPPNLVTKDERNAAEGVIMNFRNTRNAFPFCKFILENSLTELVVFETSDVLRNNLIRDWGKIPPADIEHISRHILGLVVANTRFSYSVLRRLAGVVALIVKHQSLINSGTQRRELVDMIVDGAISSTGHQLTVACCMLDGLLAEHQYVMNSDDASLTYDMHFAAKRDFENTELLKMFQFCLRYLTNYQHINDPQRNRDLDHVLRVLESILSWNFTKTNLPKRVAGVIELEATPTFKPPQSWLETINDEGFIPIFFNTHVKLRQDENFVLRSINLLAQLVSMHRPIPIQQANRVEFLSKLLPPFTAVLNMPNKITAEIYGLSDLIRKILLFNRAALLSIIQPGIMDAFFKAVGAFSCLVIHQSALEESSSNVDDKIYRESLTRVLEAWMDILTENEHVPKEMVQPIVTDIFNAYLKAHLSPPEGFRQPITEEETDGIDDEEEGSDANQFRDQLQAVGIFARFILPHSIPILTNLLTFKCQALQKQIELVASQSASPETLHCIYEDLHWGILMAGHLLAYDAMGETNLLPTEINEFSLAARADPDLSAEAFTDSFRMIPASNSDNIDPIVKLVCSVVLISETERRVNASGLGQLLSPELATNVLWFLHRFCESYFIISEEYYTSVSPCFLAAWGSGRESATVAQSYLLSRVKEDLLRYNGETLVMKEAINLLLSLVDSTKKADAAIQSPELPPIIQIANEVGPGKYLMPNDTYRKLVRAVISIGSFCDNSDKREQYWDQILNPLTTRFRNLIANHADKHRDDVRLEMACVLSGFIGSAMSAHSKTASTLYKRIGPVVFDCGAILSRYHNYVDIVELCMELVIELAKRSLSYLSGTDSLTLYQSAMSVVKAYALHASGRKSSEISAEEDTYNDLVILMDMLTCLLSKDFLDLSPESLSGTQASPAISACDVSMHGLGIILPLMNAELLQFPNLSNKYFRLVAFLSELHSDKMMALPDPMMQGVYQSVQIGLQNCATDSFTYCCEFLSCMASYISRHTANNIPSANYCKEFLKIFLEMVLSQKISKESVPAISSTLFHLISAFTDAYSELANQLLNSRTDEESRNNLSQAFHKLTENLNMNHGGDRSSRAIFRDRFEHFIFEAKGCLQ